MSPPRFGVWPSLPPDVYLRKRSDHRPFPLDRRECRLYSRARHGLWSGCRAMGLEPGDEVLAPAYHHGSEIEALLRWGLRIRFYDVTDTLQPDPDWLDRAIRPSVRVLYLVHYLGFPQDAGYWRAWCDERGLLLFEDAAQGWLASRDGIPVGSLGDLGIFCLYKTVGVPDGAALISRFPPRPPTSRRRAGAYGLMKRHGAWLSQRGGVLGTALTQLSNVAASRERTARGWVQEFDLGDPEAPPSSATTSILPRILENTIADRRRDNYRFLLEELSAVVPAPFVQLPDGACPFAFPIETNGEANLIEHLERRGVKALLFWSFPHPSLEVDGFPVAKRLRERVVALPVHQELSSLDLRRLVDAVNGVLR
jgi:dTDP-4-amino-4,6-dideoxygalactose transaminase